jgi:hypothetical protein
LNRRVKITLEGGGDSMPYFRRLPMLLRVLAIFGLLFILADVALLLWTHIIDPAAFERNSLIGLNLLGLSLACTFVVNTYSVRFRRVGLAFNPLATWQSQARCWGLLAALPLSVLLLVALLPWSLPVAITLGPLTLLGIMAPCSAFINALVSRPGRA